ncbi:hypothetical protein [Falsiroseomonas sp. E2-1-a20]|uniref:hypothetical protein n=1 Tax=Falsiroseomonas sp. E2-1-a20 TaxID=3239300 RepID=UPI003F359575
MRQLANPATAAGGGHPGPDDEMIRLCGVYVAMCHHYNTVDMSETDGNAFYARMRDVEDAIDDLPPQTLAGVVAKAQTAIALAGQEPEDTGSWQSSPAGDWARDVVHDLARLFGTGGAA